MFILDKMGIGGTLLYASLFIVAMALCVDSIIRSEWATGSAKRKAWGGIGMGMFYLFFGAWIFLRPNTKAEPENRTSTIAHDSGSEEKKEPSKPPDESPKPKKRKSPEKTTEITGAKDQQHESQLFAVDIEHRIITTPGAVTSFWFGAFGPSGCSLAPAGTAIFLRLTNLQQQKEMITAYSLKGLRKIPVNRGRMFVILPKGNVSAGFVPHVIDFGAPSGMGALVSFPVDDADASKAIPVSGDFLDYKIGEGHYLETNESVRGWVFFEYRAGYSTIPAWLTIEITDQFQRSFSYKIPDHVGNPEGDILSRRIIESPLEDLSRCVVSK